MYDYWGILPIETDPPCIVVYTYFDLNIISDEK